MGPLKFAGLLRRPGLNGTKTFKYTRLGSMSLRKIKIETNYDKVHGETFTTIKRHLTTVPLKSNKSL